MRRIAFGIVGLAAIAAVLPAAHGQGSGQGRLRGAWLQTEPAWSVTPDNPWTVMIFNPDGTFCAGSKKDSRYGEGTYAFDGARMTTISSAGRLSERTVEPGGSNRLVMHDPQLDEPVVMVRTDMFADCSALKAHQDAE